MRDLGKLLRDADPLAREGGLAPDDAHAMRRVVVAATEDDRAAMLWPRPMFVAATIVLMIATGVLVGRRLPGVDGARMATHSAGSSAAVASASSGSRRQLQFATPGGTRIIWVFDPEFNP